MSANLFIFQLVILFYALAGHGFLEILPNSYTHYQFWLKLYTLSIAVVFTMGYHGREYFYIGIIPFLLIITFTSRQSKECNNFSYFQLFTIAVLAFVTTHASYSLFTILNITVLNKLINYLLGPNSMNLYVVILVGKAILLFYAALHLCYFLFDKLQNFIYVEEPMDDEVKLFKINYRKVVPITILLLCFIVLVSTYYGDIFDIYRLSNIKDVLISN